MSEWKDGLPGVGVVCEGYITVPPAPNFKWVTVEVLKNTGIECAVYNEDTGRLIWCDKFRPIKKREPEPGEIWLYEEAPCLYTSDHGIYNLVTSEVALPSQADTKRAEFLAPSAKAYIARELLKDTNHKDEFVFCVLKDAARLDEE